MTTGQSLNNKCIKEDGEVIIKLLKELRAKWDNLDTLLTHRKTQLEEMLLMLGQFQQDFDELWAWLTTIHGQLSNPSSISGKIDTVNTLITKHSAIQEQLEAKQSTHKVVSKAGKQALSQKSREDTEILQKKLDELEQKLNEVSQMSANWQQRLENTRDELRQFNVLIVPLQKFLDKVTPRLSPSEPVYGNKDTVERLIDSHKQLQKELDGQIEKVEATKTSGNKLVNDLLDNPEPVKGSLELMSNRWDEACKASEIRQTRLDQALREAKEFEANYDDALEWVKIKSDQFGSQLAPQENATALQKQIEEQKAYSAEILAKQPEIDKVLEKGEQLLKEAHPDAVPILQNMIQELRDRWKKLKLIQLTKWVERARKTLADKQAEPIGKTLKEVEAQLAELESFQKEIAAQKPNIEDLQKVADRGGNQNMIREINDLYKKWQELELGASNRHRVLTDARKDIAEAGSFNYESWRQKFLYFSNKRKLKFSDLYRLSRADYNGQLIICRKKFIKFLENLECCDFRMSKKELEKVADVFFPDQTAQRLVSDVKNELKKKQICINKHSQRD